MQLLRGVWERKRAASHVGEAALLVFIRIDLSSGGYLRGSLGGCLSGLLFGRVLHVLEDLVVQM